MKPSMSVVFLFLELLALTTINHSVCSRSTYLNCIESERQALLRFRQDLKDPLSRLASWSGDGDCCTWAGVVCNNLTGHVLELRLGNPFHPSNDSEFEAFWGSQLSGKISPSLLDLKHLIYLNLSNNDFERIQIPKFLGSMKNLRYLDLSEAGFVGKIPHELGNLSDLTYIDLRSMFWNAIYVDNFIWLSGLSLLEYLDLSFVNISKTFDWLLVINDLPALEVLILSGCGLSHFPPLPTKNFSSLSILDLSLNELGNSIPNWFFGLTDLSFLSLFQNRFQGPIPDGLQNLTSLRHFDLSFNFFNSSIPNWLYKFSHLEDLFLDIECLSFNKLEGKIPTSWGRLCNLKTISLYCVKLNQMISEVLDIFSGCVSDRLEILNLHDGQVFGHLTNQLGKFKNLVELDLSYNSISGPVPLPLGEHSSLKKLDLSHNKLNGTISEILFTNLSRLNLFDATRNSLTLKVRPDWIPPFQLELLGLGSCHFGPQFPSWFLSQKNLGYLDISNSRILDTISSRTWKFLSQISVLNLSHNQIHGKIPHLTEARITVLDLNSNNLSGPLPPISSNVIHLDLSNNKFSGSIFQFLCYKMNNESKQMQILNLKNNILVGELPECWMNWQRLLYLNLGNNKFTGTLPTSMGTLGSLQSLNLHKNSLFGTIPASFKTIKYLNVLDISENEFVGEVPTWIGESFSRMMILNLRSNKFHGILPTELCHLFSLQILDLANNNFSGTIPRCVNNFSAMVTLNDSTSNSIQYFSSNIRGMDFVSADAILVMKGETDEYSTILNLVRIIDFSRNNFFGEIPIEVTKLEALQSLNLSHNFLTGRIPTNIGTMTFIESIDFSGNQLSGEIPSGISNLSFLNHLNLSNNNLSGRIPSSTQLQSFDASCFIGNELCGSPLPKNCTETDSVPSHEQGIKNVDEHDVDWFYVGLALGFVVGFWSVIGPLLVNRRWRYMYCHLLDFVGDKFCSFVRKCW